MDAEEMYSRTIENLGHAIEGFTVGKRSGQRLFAELHDVNRANLQQVLAGNQEISVALFLKLAAALEGKQAPALPPGVERWSLRTWLEMEDAPVHRAMYVVNFNEQGKVQKGKKTEFLT